MSLADRCLAELARAASGREVLEAVLARLAEEVEGELTLGWRYHPDDVPGGPLVAGRSAAAHAPAGRVTGVEAPRGWLGLEGLDCAGGPRCVAAEAMLAAVGPVLDATWGRFVAEDGARRASARLEALVRHLQAGVMVEDADRRLILVNEDFCVQFGIAAPPEALIGADCVEAARASASSFEDPQGFLRGIEATLSARVPVVGEVLRMVDGRVLERDYLPIDVEGQPSGHLWLYRDRTEVRATLERLARSEASLAAVLASTEDPIWSLDRDLRLRTGNRAFGELFADNWDTHPRAGEGLELLGDPEERAAHERLYRAVLSGRSLRVTWCPPQQPDRHFDVRLSPVRGEEGIDGVAVYARDITERVRAEALLAEAKRAAEQESAAKSAFLAHMSHELRTPLHAMTGLADLLDEAPLDPSARELLDGVRRNGQAMLQVVRDLLDLSKIEAGVLDLEGRPFDPLHALEAVVGLHAQEAARKGLELLVDHAPALPARVEGDPDRFRQVAANLVANAVKYTDRGHVHVRLDMRGDGLVLIVEDSGEGIAAADRERVFEPFFRAPAAARGRAAGTGLGLAITRSLVERMGGHIGVEASPGGGSRFEVVLPLRAVEAPPEPVDPADRTRVVLATDRDAVARALVPALEGLGAEVERVRDGRALLATLPRAGTPRALLVDLTLPGPSVHALAGLLARHPGSVGARRVALVEAGGRPPDLGSAFDDLVSLPADRAALRRALGERRSPARQAPRLVRPQRILLVEDGPENRLWCRTVLERAGHAVVEAERGEEAWARLAEDGFDLVFMDVDLPGLDGLELVTRLREREVASGRPATPVVALTAYATEAVRQRCLRAGMDAFLAKPVDGGRLLEAVRAWARATVHVVLVDSDPSARASARLALERCGARVTPLGTAADLVERGTRLAADVVVLDEDQGAGAAAGAAIHQGGGPPWIGLSAHAEEGPRPPGCAARLRKPTPRDRLVEAVVAAVGLSSAPATGRPEDPYGLEAIRDLVPAFVQRRRASAEAVAGQVDAGDWESVRRAGHILKGTAAPYGFADLGEVGARLEAAAGRRDGATCRALARRIVARLDGRDQPEMEH